VLNIATLPNGTADLTLGPNGKLFFARADRECPSTPSNGYHV
jgi:hypothetical protein